MRALIRSISQCYRTNLKVPNWASSIFLFSVIFVGPLSLIYEWSMVQYFAAVMALMFVLLAWPVDNPKSRFGQYYFPLMMVPLFFTFLWAFCIKSFGVFEPASILFHLKSGVSGNGATDSTMLGVFFFALFIVLTICLSYLGMKSSVIRHSEKLFAIPLLCINPVTIETVQFYFNQDKGNFLSAHYQDLPAGSYTVPVKKKNILWVYLESFEATYENKVFGETFKELKDLSSEGLRINGVKEVRNTGWTIAGMTASQCGVPLLSLGLFMGNNLTHVDSFMPGAHCLGDILHKEGYQTAYMGGAPLYFAGKGKFYRQHKFDIVKGGRDISNTDRDYVNLWGQYDDTLFADVKKQIKEFAAKDKPYAMVTLTIAGHRPDGYPSKTCLNELKGPQEPQILFATRCSAYLTQKLIKELRAEGLLKDTLVIVSSDHLSMKNPVWSDLKQYPRENFVVILGDNIQPRVINRHASMLDLYPTILELAGFKLPNHRAGLGVSLLSPEKTLIEQYGMEKVNQAILFDQKLRHELWEFCEQTSCSIPMQTAKIENSNQSQK